MKVFEGLALLQYLYAVRYIETGSQKPEGLE